MNLLLVLFLAACGGGDATDAGADAPAKADKAKGKKRPQPPKGDPIQVKGVLDFGDAGAVLKPCGGGEPLTLRAGSGDPNRVRSELGESIDDVYVEMRGLKQEDGAVVVKAFDVAMVGFDGCANPLDVTITGFGSEPAWKADVKGEELVVTAPDAKAPVTYTGLKKTDVKMPITFEAAAADGSKATFALKRERCKDLKINAFFPWAVTVDAGGKTLKGCARGELPKAAKAPTPTAAPAEAPEAGAEE